MNSTIPGTGLKSKAALSCFCEEDDDGGDDDDDYSVGNGSARAAAHANSGSIGDEAVVVRVTDSNATSISMASGVACQCSGGSS